MLYFEVREFYTQKDFTATAHVSFHRSKRRPGAFRIAFVFILAVAIGQALLTIPFAADTRYTVSILSSIAVLVLIVLFFVLFGGKLLASLIGQSMWNKYPYKDAERRFIFQDEQFCSGGTRCEARYDYDAVTYIREDAERFFLYTSDNQYYIFRKDSFTQGDPEQFREFIQQKTGKAVEYVK